jgi:hypothetical protein
MNSLLTPSVYFIDNIRLTPINFFGTYQFVEKIHLMLATCVTADKPNKFTQLYCARRVVRFAVNTLMYILNGVFRWIDVCCTKSHGCRRTGLISLEERGVGLRVLTKLAAHAVW